MKTTRSALLAACGIVTTGVLGRWASGTVYTELEAREMIEALSQSALYLGSAIAGSSATTLALMLTLLGLIKRVDEDFDQAMYKRINQIGILSTALLGGSVVMLLLMTFPMGEFDNVPSRWFPILYEVLFGFVVALSAALVALVVMLYAAVRTLIANVTPGGDV